MSYVSPLLVLVLALALTARLSRLRRRIVAFADAATRARQAGGSALVTELGERGRWSVEPGEADDARARVLALNEWRDEFEELHELAQLWPRGFARVAFASGCGLAFVELALVLGGNGDRLASALGCLALGAGGAALCYELGRRVRSRLGRSRADLRALRAAVEGHAPQAAPGARGRAFAARRLPR